MKEETELIIGIGIDIHKTLGFGFLEIVYKDAFDYEFKQQFVAYERVKEYSISYKGIILSHRFYADYVVFDKVILEVKAKNEIADEDYARTINYLRCSDCTIGLILNFGRARLGIKRVIF